MVDIQETTEVIILTSTYKVQGRINLYSGVRLTDYIRQSGEFIAVSNAQVFDLNGKELFQSSFLDIGKLSIEIITPLSALTKLKSE